MAMGEQVLAEGDAPRAVSIFRQVRDMAPDDPEVIGGLARALIAAGETDEARIFSTALPDDLKTKPEITRARAALELASRAGGRHGGALEARLAANPDDHEARFELAAAKMAAGNRDAAADALLEIISRDREWNDGAARKRFLQLLEAQGLEDPWSSAQRRRLSAAAVHMSRTLRVPIFPLAGAILFPRSQLPLHIFEPRYREMVRDAIDGAGRIAMIQPLRLDDDNRRRCTTSAASATGRRRGARRRPLQHRPARHQPLPPDRREPRSMPPIAAPRSTSKRSTTASRRRCRSLQRAEIEREARRLGDALGLAVDWAAVARLDDEMLVNAIAQVAPFDVGAKQALLEAATLDGRADLLVQLMQFHRVAVTGGVEIEPTLQ